MKQLNFILLLVVAMLIATNAFAAKAEDFSLMDMNGAAYEFQSDDGKVKVLEWMNPDCPFVKKHYASGNMQGLQQKYTAEGVTWITINSSAPGKQGNYSSAEWQQIYKDSNMGSTAMLIDETGEVGTKYGAKTTPHMFIVGPEGDVLYQGAIDDNASTDPADIEGSVNYVAKALDEILGGKEVSESVTKSYGCSVKY